MVSNGGACHARRGIGIECRHTREVSVHGFNDRGPLRVRRSGPPRDVQQDAPLFPQQSRARHDGHHDLASREQRHRDPAALPGSGGQGAFGGDDREYPRRAVCRLRADDRARQPAARLHQHGPFPPAVGRRHDRRLAHHGVCRPLRDRRRRLQRALDRGARRRPRLGIGRSGHQPAHRDALSRREGREAERAPRVVAGRAGASAGLLGVLLTNVGFSWQFKLGFISDPGRVRHLPVASASSSRRPSVRRRVCRSARCSASSPIRCSSSSSARCS